MRDYLCSLRDRPLWGVWKLEPGKNGKMTKVPYSAARSGRASTTDPAAWTSFRQAAKKLERQPGEFNGIALVIPEDSGIVFTDLDHCRTENGWSEKAQHVMQLFQYSYLEISQSGEGIHIISCGEIPDSFKNSAEGVEMYSQARFCAMTGNVIGDFDDVYGEDKEALNEIYHTFYKKRPEKEYPALPAYTPTLDDLQVIAKASHSKNGRKFSDLYEAGRWSDYFASQSEADLCLCSMLAFWCNRDPEMVDRLFRSSALYRAKWDRDDYRERTISLAVNSCRECYQELKARQEKEDFSDGGNTVGSIEPEKPFRSFRSFRDASIYEKNSRTGAFDPIQEFGKADPSILPEFDPNWLPPAFAEFVRGVAESLQVPADMVAPGVLTAIAATIQKKFSVMVKDDYFEPLSFYAAIIAPPSERKSPVLKLIQDPFLSYQQEKNEKLQPAIQKYELDKKRWNKKMAKLINDEAKKAENDETDYQFEIESLALCEPIPVKKVKIVTTDVTSEKLAEMMKDNRECMTVFAAEGGIFQTMAGRYSEGRSNIDIYLQGYSHEYVSIDRVTRGSLELYHPALSMLLYVQPEIITNITGNKEFRGRGLLARFAYVIPKTLIGRRRFDTIPLETLVKEGYGRSIKQLLNIEVPADNPLVLMLDDGAKALAKQFYDAEIEKNLLSAAEIGMGDWAGKEFGQCMRIAGLIHAMKHLAFSVDHHLIDADTVLSAIKIERYLWKHAQYVFNVMGATETKGEAVGKQILKKIMSLAPRTPNTPKTPEIALQDLFQACKTRQLDTREKMQAGLDELILRNYIRVRKRTNTGGRPSEIVEINPALFVEEGD